MTEDVMLRLLSSHLLLAVSKNMMPNTSATDPCQVIELRHYTLRPHQRDVLIDLFEREFIETQEAVGIRVIGQFRDIDRPDRFVWVRGFSTMAARPQALASFYGGTAWQAHRDAANATMIDSDNVHLLRPAWHGAGLSADPSRRAPIGATHVPHGVVNAQIVPLKEPASLDLLNCCRAQFCAALRNAGAQQVAWFVTEASANNFPRLPVREGEHVLVALTLSTSPPSSAIGDAWAREIAPQLAQWQSGPSEYLRLTPTARSALHS
jgi:hypothetical protein